MGKRDRREGKRAASGKYCRLQIADIYDALTTDRSYRPALLPEEALQVLLSETKNGWLDSSVVLQFSRICRSSEYFPVRGRTMLAYYYA